MLTSLSRKEFEGLVDEGKLEENMRARDDYLLSSGETCTHLHVGRKDPCERNR